MGSEITKAGDGAISVHALKASRPGFLSFCRNGLMVEHGEATIFSDRTPTPRQRETLVARVASLTGALAPSWTRTTGDAIAMMLTVLPSQAGSATDDKVRGAAYRMALDGLPAWAIEAEAVAMIRANRHWAPTPGEFRHAVSNALADVRVELRQINEILGARVIAPPNFTRQAAE